MNLNYEETSLIRFAEIWNERYPEFKILIRGTDEAPFGVSIRYPISKYYGYYLNNFREWGDLQHVTAECSMDTMVVTSDRELFSRGIIEIAIACQMSDYKNELAMDVLEHLARQLAPMSTHHDIAVRVSER